MNPASQRLGSDERFRFEVVAKSSPPIAYRCAAEMWTLARPFPIGLARNPSGERPSLKHTSFGSIARRENANKKGRAPASPRAVPLPRPEVARLEKIPVKTAIFALLYSL
jgi:hypothetical protein